MKNLKKQKLIKSLIITISDLKLNKGGNPKLASINNRKNNNNQKSKKKIDFINIKERELKVSINFPAKRNNIKETIPCLKEQKIKESKKLTFLKKQKNRKFI